MTLRKSDTLALPSTRADDTPEFDTLALPVARADYTPEVGYFSTTNCTLKFYSSSRKL